MTRVASPLFAACLALGACSGDDPTPGGPPDEVTRERWFAEVAAVACERIFACCDAAERARVAGMTPFASVGECAKRLEGARAGDASRWADLARQGRIVWNGVAAGACLRKLRGLPCAEANVTDVRAVPPACEPFITGTAGEGTPCLDGYECASGNCPTRSILGPPSCAAGPRCDSHEGCQAGSFCAYEETNRCEGWKKAGAACFQTFECGTGSYCRMDYMTGTRACAAQIDDGAVCSDQFSCKDAAFCKYGSGSPVCTPRVGEGQPCGYEQRACLPGLFCDGKCQPLLGDGKPCGTPLQCRGGACLPGDGGQSCAAATPLCDGV